jgi:hypothetical protein
MWRRMRTDRTLELKRRKDIKKRNKEEERAGATENM